MRQLGRRRREIGDRGDDNYEVRGHLAEGEGLVGGLDLVLHPLHEGDPLLRRLVLAHHHQRWGEEWREASKREECKVVGTKREKKRRVEGLYTDEGEAQGVALGLEGGDELPGREGGLLVHPGG